MSWLNVGKSFNSNGFAVVVSDVASADAVQKKIEHKRRYDDFESSSSDGDIQQSKSKRIRISNEEEMTQFPRKTIDVSWCIDRRRGSMGGSFLHRIQDVNDVDSSSISSDSSDLSHRERKRKKKIHKKEKKRSRKDSIEKLIHIASIPVVEHLQENCELQVRKSRYFSRSYKFLLLGPSFKRFKIDRGVDRDDNQRASFTISYLPLSIDNGLVKFFDQENNSFKDEFTNISDKIISDQSIIMTRIKFWSELHTQLIQKITSNLNYHEFDNAMRSFASIQYLLFSCMEVSSGQWELYPINFFFKTARMTNYTNEVLTNEKIVSFLDQLLKLLSDTISENNPSFDLFSAKILYHMLSLQQNLLPTVDFDKRLSEYIDEYPLSAELHQLARLRLRSMYPTSSFKKLREYESSFWNEMQTKAKNKAAARRLMLNLSGSVAAESALDDESILRSVQMQRYRIESLANYCHILQVMGYQEHCTAFFQCLVTIHLREMEETNAVFLVREVLRQWESETEPRLGEMAYSTKRQWDDTTIIHSLLGGDNGLLYRDILCTTEEVFPSKVLSESIVREGPDLPPPIVEEEMNSSNQRSTSGDNAAQYSSNSHLEVVNGKVLMYSRLHGYKIWVPVDATAEDTTMIYRRILDAIDDDGTKSDIPEEKKQNQRSSSVAANSVESITRLIHADATTPPQSNSYLKYVQDDSIASCLQFSPLRALGLNYPENEEMAMKEMEMAEKYPEKVVFSDDLKPFMFSMRDNLATNQVISVGTRSLSFFLAHLGPSSLGIHCPFSTSGLQREMEQLQVNASIFTRSSPTLAVVCELLRQSHPLHVPKTKEEVLSGCLQMLDTVGFPFAPIFVSDELTKAHIIALSTESTSLDTPRESRLIFVTRIFHQILQHAVSFQTKNWQEIVKFVKRERQWLDMFISQLRQSLLHLIFVRCKAELQVLLSTKHATEKDVLNQNLLKLIENCRTSCRTLLEESSAALQDERDPFEVCMAGDLRMWSQYLFIEKELLLLVQEHIQTDQPRSFSLFVPIWKMAEKVLRILDSQRAQAPLYTKDHHVCMFPGEECFYSSIVTLLLQALAMIPPVNDANFSQQRRKHIFVSKLFLVQRAFVALSGSSTKNQQSSPLKLLIAMDGKNKKQEKTEELAVNPMEMQEAIQLWQSHIQLTLTQTSEDLLFQKELLSDLPHVVHSIRCQAVLCGLSLFDDNQIEQPPAPSEICSRFISFQTSIQESLSRSDLSIEQQKILKLLSCELHLVHVQVEMLFSLAISRISPSIATFCEWIAEGLTHFPDDPRLLGCWVHFQYFGKGFGSSDSVHHGYRKLRQYWQRLQTERALREVTQDVRCLREFQQYQGCSGEYLSVRERCFEIAVEFIRHNRVLFNILYSQGKECPKGTMGTKMLLPDWKDFFTNLVPHYRVMYEYQSYDEIITGDNTKLCLPAITESCHRLSALFEQIVSCPTGQNIPWIWRLYIHTTLSIGDVESAKKIARRGLAKCGYCKALFLDLLGPLTASVPTRERNDKSENETEVDGIVLMRMMESQGIFLRSYYH